MGTIDIKEIDRWLERGDVLAVAKEQGIEKSSAYRYMNGKIKKVPVLFLEKVMDKAIKNKARLSSKWATLQLTGTNQLRKA